MTFGLTTTQSEILGSILLYLSSSLSSAGGVGGGALNVPLLYFVWGFTYTQSVILSLATLMGNYLLQVLVNLPQRHPIDLTRPLIYWDAVLVLLPAELGGANIGVLLSNIFPTSLDLILGMIVLVIATYGAMEKGIEQYNKETLLMGYDKERTPLLRNADEDDFDDLAVLGPDLKWSRDAGDEDRLKSTSPGPLQDPSITGGGDESAAGATREGETPEAPGGVSLTESILEDFDREQSARKRRWWGGYSSTVGGSRTGATPRVLNDRATQDSQREVRTHRSYRTTKSMVRRMPSITTASGSEIYDLSGAEAVDEELPPIEFPWFIISVILVVWLIYAALYISMEDVTKCSWIYFTLLCSIYPLLAAEIVWGTFFLQEKQEDDRMVGKFVKGDIDWRGFSFMIPLFAFVVGILSSLLGIGGGELMGPMLLQLGVLPTVSPATTSLMSFLNTSSSFIHYLTLGEVPYAYAAWVFGIGCAGGEIVCSTVCPCVSLSVCFFVRVSLCPCVSLSVCLFVRASSVQMLQPTSELVVIN